MLLTILSVSPCLACQISYLYCFMDLLGLRATTMAEWPIIKDRITPPNQQVNVDTLKLIFISQISLSLCVPYTKVGATDNTISPN
jgi:hypothetical protein